LSLTGPARNDLDVSPPERNTVADAALIADVARALRDWERSTGAAATLKPLREAVWFYWERWRLPTPRVRGKYPVSVPWSAAARAAHEADPEHAALEIEHSEPMAMMLRRMLDDPDLEGEDARRILSAPDRFAVVTAQESKALAAAGLAQRMPDAWVSADGLDARYQAAGLDTSGFAPLRAPD
jgi:hypothetical protein